jgi:hypothetical protein
MGLTIFARVSRGIAAAASVTVAARSVASGIFSPVYVNVTPCELMRVSVSSPARESTHVQDNAGRLDLGQNGHDLKLEPGDMTPRSGRR